MTWCYRIAKPGDGTLGKRMWEDSGRYRQHGPRWKINGSLEWFSLFQAFRCTFSWNIVASYSNWRTRMKRNGEEISPYPSPPLPTPAPIAAYSCSLFFPRILRAEALRCPPHYRQSHFALRISESWDYSRKTKGSKNGLYRVEPPYLRPFFP